MPLGWLLYLGLPITAAGVLFALRLINLGAGGRTGRYMRAAALNSTLVQGVYPEREGSAPPLSH
jgi:hypothetical protein